MTAKDLRKSFWEAHPKLSRRKIKNYSGTGTMYVTDTRVAWNDYKDLMQKSGQITPEQANTIELNGG